MNLRPKTKRRLLALAAGGVIFGAASSVLVYVQLNREENRQRELRSDALGAFQRGDYLSAIADFKQYHSTDRLDGEAIYAYAVSRSKVPLPDLGHLREAKSLFTRYLELKPNDDSAQHQLLEIYRRLSYTAEANALADSLLGRNADDVPALNVKLGVLASQGKYADALRIAEQLNALTPADLQTQETTFDLMLRCNRPPTELTTRADRILSEHPADARFELLRADAALMTGDREGARRWLRTAAAQTPTPDPRTLQLLAAAFDRIGMWDDARTLIEKSADAPAAPSAVTAEWVLRLWETGQIDQALSNLKNITADNQSDARLLGIKAMILFGRSPADAPDPQATAALKNLDARPDDLIAASWAALLHADFVEGLNDPKQAIIFGEVACRQDPDNAVARFDLGRAYLRLGESELALNCLTQATQIAPNWSSPFVVIARTLLERGQIAAANIPAQAAFDRNSASSAAQTTLAVTVDLQPNLADLNRGYAFVKKVHEGNPDDMHVLAAYADLLARTDRRQEASDLILSTIAGASINAETLYDLFKVSEANHLDLSDAITDRATRHSPATPDGLFDQIRLFSAAGRAVEAHRTIRAAQQNDGTDWKLAVLRSRELVGDANLAPAWAEFADAEPENLAVQHAVISSPIAWTDRMLIARAIDRCKALTGNDAVEWRMTRAHWQLESTDDPKGNASAVAAEMAEVVTIVPRMLEPHLLWADSLERLGDMPGAIAQMRAAQVIAPTPDVTVKLARLLTTQGQYRDAVALVDSVKGDPTLTGETRDIAVHVLCQSGQSKKAIEILEANPGNHTSEQDLLLARIYTDQGDDISASHLYGRLMQVPKPPNAVLREFARFQASRGDLAEARDTIGRLDTTAAVPGEVRLTLADFEAAFGTPQSAAAAYQQATSEAPSDPKTWLAFAGFNLRTHEYRGAAAAADDGLKFCAGDAGLSAMSSCAKLLSALSPPVDAQCLVDSLATDPASVPGQAVLNELIASESVKETADKLSSRLAAIAERYPQYLPVRLMLASSYRDVGAYDDAVLTATRAEEAFPASVEPSQLLTEIDIAAARWDAALAAATEWRNRSLAHPQPADNVIASDQERLEHPEQALDVLSPYLPRAVPAVSTSPDLACDDSVTLCEYARALAMLHRFSDARALLAPLCKQSVAWRRQSLQIIADTAPDAGSAVEQMSWVQAMIRDGSVDDRIALADARYVAGVRLNDPGLLQKSLDVLEPLTDAGAVPVDAWVLLGAIHQQMNQLPDAEIAYRKALAISPNLALAENNLAMVILQRNGDLKEASKLAQQAVSVEPGNSALHGTLGEIEAQAGDLDSALAQLETAIRLDPQNAAALVALADTECKTARSDKAIETLRRVDDVMQVTHKPLDPAVKHQLDRVREACRRAAAVG